MRCPHCGSEESKVIDSRTSDDGSAIRRRRECIDCADRFTTYERCEEKPLLIVKKDGTIQQFNQAKLMRGLIVATAKRNVSQESLDQLILDIETELRNTFRNRIGSKELGDMVLIRLLKLDKVAYVRFASVYKDFKDLDEFTNELKDLAQL